jgi:hypothetical protein
LTLVRAHKWRLASQRRKEAIAAWKYSSPVPADIRKIVRAYGDNSTFEILQALSPSTGIRYAREMYHSCPGILYLLVNNPFFTTTQPGRRLQAARTLIQRPQRDILQVMGFPGGQSAVTILNKISPRHLRLTRLLRLRDLLKEDQILATLRQAPAISAPLLELLLQGYYRWLAPRFLRQLSHESVADQIQAYCHLRPAVELLASLPPDRRALLPLAKGVITGWRFLRDLRARAEHLRDNPRLLLDQPLPPPPIPDHPARGIYAITHGLGLLQEGSQMHNCAANLLPQILRGEYYLFRLAGSQVPERATVGIRRRGTRGWVLDRVAGVFNVPANLQTYDWIAAWLQNRDPAEVPDDPGEPYYSPPSPHVASTDPF